tara:strand:+ start:2505 stop:2720 length:216 start_codon:yes stop_codon:yes gene_type:complete
VELSSNKKMMGKKGYIVRARKRRKFNSRRREQVVENLIKKKKLGNMTQKRVGGAQTRTGKGSLPQVSNLTQ